MICSLKHIQYLRRFAIENHFSLPDGFMQKPIRWVWRQYNGIGAEWLPMRVRKFLTRFLRHMEAASMVHDVEYLSENKSFWRFTVANMRLIWNGIKSRHPLSGLVLGTVCQLFGWSAWIEGKETMAYHYYFSEGQR